jgi:hypothetical protein
VIIFSVENNERVADASRFDLKYQQKLIVKTDSASSPIFFGVLFEWRNRIG